MEPAVQAYVQASAKSVVCFPGVSLGMPAVLGLVTNLPMLHAADYEHVLQLPGVGVWSVVLQPQQDVDIRKGRWNCRCICCHCAVIPSLLDTFTT
jgi:hypothetical protein